ncbi:MAG: hypothetical protein ACM3MG_10985 [Bacillota bacterium]
MKKMWLVVALFLGFSGAAHAGVMIEPYLGYEMGSSSGGSLDAKTSFTNFGARLAWRAPVMFWLGLDANIGMSGKIKPDTGSDFDSKRTTYYAVAGIDLPILLRGWVGYGFSNTFKNEDVTNSKWTGKTTKIGVGFTGLPFISLNLEYLKDTVDKIESDLGTNNSPNVDHSSYMLSVSLPLNF